MKKNIEILRNLILKRKYYIELNSVEKINEYSTQIFDLKNKITKSEAENLLNITPDTVLKDHLLLTFLQFQWNDFYKEHKKEMGDLVNSKEPWIRVMATVLLKDYD